jgi:hypothetical protein
MSRETQFKEIGGDKYACHMMPATIANKTLIELVDVVGRPAATILANAFTAKDIGDLDVEELVSVAMQAVFQRMDGDRGDALMKAILNGVVVEGKGDVVKNFDDHFRGRILTLYKVFRWAVEVNYQDFFDAVRSSALITKISSVGAKAYSQLTTTRTSTDSSSPAKASTSPTSGT